MCECQDLYSNRGSINSHDGETQAWVRTRSEAV
jgi:hypothetical protein